MQVNLKRLRRYSDKLRRYKIIVDGQLVGHISNGEEKILELSDSAHSIYLKIDWCTSPVIQIGPEKSEHKLTCHNSFSGWKMFFLPLPLYYISFGRKKYIALFKNE